MLVDAVMRPLPAVIDPAVTRRATGSIRRCELYGFAPATWAGTGLGSTRCVTNSRYSERWKTGGMVFYPLPGQGWPISDREGSAAPSPGWDKCPTLIAGYA